MAYVELHCHSAYSFLDGASQPEELAARAAELGYEAQGFANAEELYVALVEGGTTPDLLVLDSTDPEAVLGTERAVDLDKTLFVVSSKSGGTVETLSHMRYFYERCGGDGSRFVAVTEGRRSWWEHGRERGRLTVVDVATGAPHQYPVSDDPPEGVDDSEAERHELLGPPLFVGPDQVVLSPAFGREHRITI